jgi:hypothetical protein
VRPQGDDGEQAEQNWRGSKNCFVGPLALGFNAEVGADFLEGNLDLPAADEPAEDIARMSVEIGRQEGLRVEFTGGIANEKPSDRHWRRAAAIPQCSAGRDLDHAIGSTVPLTDPVARPGDIAILENGRELFLGFASDRTAAGTLTLWRREVEQIGIKPQAGDDANMLADGSEEFNGHIVLFTSADQSLGDLAALHSDSALRRRLRHHAGPGLLVIDEVSYLSYSNRHADLLFELVNRRYEHKSTLVTTNRPFAEWREVFPNAACVVSLVDRLIHHTEIFAIEGESYRLKEAQERSEQRSRQRRRAKP